MFKAFPSYLLAALVSLGLFAPAVATAQPAPGAGRRVALPSYGFSIRLAEGWFRTLEGNERVVLRANLVRDKTVISAVDVQILDGSAASAAQLAERIARNADGEAALSPIEIGGAATVVVTIDSPAGTVKPRRIYVVERDPWIYQIVHFAYDDQTAREEVEALLRTIELKAPEPPHRNLNFDRPPLPLFSTNLSMILPDPLRLMEVKQKDTFGLITRDFSDRRGGMTLIVELKAERSEDMDRVVQALQSRVKEFYKLPEAPRFTRVRTDPDVYASEPFVDTSQPRFKPHMMVMVVAPDPKHQIIFTVMLGQDDPEEVQAHADAARRIAESIQRR